MPANKKKIKKQLKALKDFANTKRVQALRKELQDKLKRIESGVRIGKKVIQQQANLSRSSKMRKYHHYLSQIVQSYPDLTYKEVRKQYKARKKGKDVKIPDAVWFNPSP